MLEVPFLYGELILLVLWLLCRVFVWLRRGRIDWRREATLLLMLFNLAVIVRFVFYLFFPQNGRLRPLVLRWEKLRPFWINLVPLVHLKDFQVKREALINVLGNVALFVPSGIILPVLYKRLDRFWKVVLAGFTLSLSLELIQLFTPRCSDVDDLILNTLGVALGYGVYRLFHRPNVRA